MAATMRKYDELLKEDPDRARHHVQDIIEETERRIAEMKPAKNTRIPLSKQRGIEKLPIFNGMEYLPFQKKIVSFCQDDPGVADVLKAVGRKYVKNKLDDIQKDTLQEMLSPEFGIKALSAELHALLGLVTTGLP